MTNITKTLSLIIDPSRTSLDPIEQLFAVRHDRSGITACHNLASARAIAEGRAPSRTTEASTERPFNADAFVAPSGQYYVMIKAGMQQVRMDVANAQTARHYARNGVSWDITREAYVSSKCQENVNS